MRSHICWIFGGKKTLVNVDFKMGLKWPCWRFYAWIRKWPYVGIVKITFAKKLLRWGLTYWPQNTLNWPYKGVWVASGTYSAQSEPSTTAQVPLAYWFPKLSLLLKVMLIFDEPLLSIHSLTKKLLASTPRVTGWVQLYWGFPFIVKTLHIIIMMT